MWTTSTRSGSACMTLATIRAKPNNKDAACGDPGTKRCPKNDDCPYGLECEHGGTRTWLPSILRINVYNPDGSLRADAYQARISSSALGDGGCSEEEQIASALAGFIPGAGQYFAAGLAIDCVRQGS
ncbi:hypothetical protein IL306_013058 [Fusarium sp. DS 682]|nr:hypothetical protein IL306_013058 [Fusarium sp. DS 682]